MPVIIYAKASSTPGPTVQIALTPTTLSLSSGTPTGTVTGVAKDINGNATGQAVYYYSSNTSVVTVNNTTGLVTRVGAGSATVYGTLVAAPVGPVEPVYVNGVSTNIFVVDSAAPVVVAGVEALANDVTYRNGETVSIGDRRTNYANASPTTDFTFTVDTNTHAIVPSFTVTTDYLKAGIYIYTGTGTVTTGQYYVTDVDVSGSRLFLSQTYKGGDSFGNGIGGAQSVVGTAGNTGTGGYALIALNAANLYEATVGGTCGKTGGPTNGTLNSTSTDGAVTWKNIGTSSLMRPIPEQLANGVSTVGHQLVTGKGGTGLAARATYNDSSVPFTDFVIDSGDNTKITSSLIPGSLGLYATVNVTGGTGFTVQNNVTILSVDSSGKATMSAAMGTVGSTGGTGTGYSEVFGQMGRDWSAGNVTVPASPSTSTIVEAAQIRINGVKADFEASGLQIKWLRMPYTNNGQPPQGSSIIYTATDAPSPWPPVGHGFSIFGYVPQGCIDFHGQSNPNLTDMVIDGSDNTKFTLATPQSLYAGGQYTVTSGTGFTPQTFFLRFADSVWDSGGVGMSYRAYDAATGLTPISLGVLGSTGGHATFVDPGYPLTNDGGLSPFGASPTDYMDNAWHQHTWVYRPHSAATSLDGTWQYWIDGTLMVWIDQQAVGVTPTGGLKQWCSQSLVCNHPIAAGIVGTTGIITGVLTQPGPNTEQFTVDINLGDGTYTNTDGWRMWKV